MGVQSANVWSGSSGTSTPADPDSQFTDPDNQNFGKGIRPFGSDGPVVQFSVQQKLTHGVARALATNFVKLPELVRKAQA